MEENKILEILKKVPLGTELYSPAFGKIMFNGIRNSFANEQRIAMSDENEIGIAFLTDGRFKKSGEVMLFPSDKMRNWDKFAWKKGDVLVNSKGIYCLFIEFSGYPYTNFTAMFVNVVGSLIIDSIIKVTQEWHKASSEDAEKYIEYINTNLKKVNKRLNLETLEVEKSKPEFKLEHEFQPFEKVLVRDVDTDKWTVDLYGFKENNDDYVYQCVGGCCVYCIPYEGNEHLLGTTNSPED